MQTRRINGKAVLCWICALSLGWGGAVRGAERSLEKEDSTNEVLENVEAILGGGENPQNAYNKIELLTEILLQVKRYYVEEKNYEEVMDGAIHGLLQSLDPYSDYMPVRAYAQMKDETRGAYGGIGVHIATKNGILTVVSPVEDSPAFKAGILAGDRIVEIDGVKTVNIKQGDAVERLRGKQGSEVRLTIARENMEGFKEYTLVREEIELPSVKGARVLRGNIGYVRVTQFAEPTAKDLEDAVRDLLGKGMKGLVLDLRNNPGGLVNSAVDVSSLFLADKAMVVTTRGRKGVYTDKPSRSSGPSHYLDFPMVVLVNAYSASAAEIVSGALQDHRRAVLVGETTFGKASVQSVIPSRVEEGSGIRLTTAHYYTPAGRMIHENGIEPDIAVYIPMEEWVQVVARRAYLESPDLFTEEEKKKFQDAVDRQLERALDLLEAWNVVGARATASVAP